MNTSTPQINPLVGSTGMQRQLAAIIYASNITHIATIKAAVEGMRDLHAMAETIQGCAPISLGATGRNTLRSHIQSAKYYSRLMVAIKDSNCLRQRTLTMADWVEIRDQVVEMDELECYLKEIVVGFKEILELHGGERME